MTFRITSSTGDGGDRLQIAGELTREGLTELGRAVAASGRPLTLDRGELRQVDAGALAALADLEARGMRLVGVSQYLRLPLDQATGSPR